MHRRQLRELRDDILRGGGRQLERRRLYNAHLRQLRQRQIQQQHQQHPPPALHGGGGIGGFISKISSLFTSKPPPAQPWTGIYSEDKKVNGQQVEDRPNNLDFDVLQLGTWTTLHNKLIKTFPTVTNVRKLPDDLDQVAVIGDLHGNWHGFKWNMLQLIQKGFFEESPTEVGELSYIGSQSVTDNFHLLKLKLDKVLIFTGDILDRGAYDLEILYMVYTLCYRNPKNVFVTQGNHEEGMTWLHKGYMNNSFCTGYAILASLRTDQWHNGKQ